jgi:autophagy-related protein 17
MVDLTDLRSLYEGFLDAYDGLILEVTRRKAVRIGVEKVLQEARGKLDKLFEEDVRAREAFRTEQGDYLPSDIWPGLGRGPMRIEFTRFSGGKLDGGAYAERKPLEGHEGEDMGPIPSTMATATWRQGVADGSGDSIPDLPRHVVEKALGRLKIRAKGPRGPPP